MIGYMNWISNLIVEYHSVYISAQCHLVVCSVVVNG